MIDRKLLKEDADYRARIEAKRVDPALIDSFLDVDDQRSVLSQQVDELRAQRNAVSKDIGKAAPDEREEKIAAAAKVKEQLDGLETQLSELDAQHRELILQIPNPIDPSVPLGGEDDYDVVSTHGEQHSSSPDGSC
jgi:seryl-tRNA synthetase